MLSVSDFRVLTQHWIAHALQHGDLGRIIDPLLLLLLHPATARVSVHYASFSRVKRAAVPEAQDRANEKPQPRRPDKGGGTEPEPGVGDQSGPTRRGDVSDTLNSDVTGGKKRILNNLLFSSDSRTFPFTLIDFSLSFNACHVYMTLANLQFETLGVFSQFFLVFLHTCCV